MSATGPSSPTRSRFGFAQEGSPRVYTIAAGLPFVDALAAGILDRVGPDPETLADVVVLLPNRRACRSLADAFLRVTRGRALLLPRLKPLGDLDDEELALTGWTEAGLEDAGTGLDLPPPVGAARRLLLLARLVESAQGRRTDPDQAVRLAAELARLLDQVETERLGFDRLADLVPADYAEHWGITLAFLRILTDRWPAILAEEGCVGPARRRNLVLEAQARAWTRHPPGHPVIAAGSTGSIPATAELLQVVAHLPQGAVVLPGLDVALDADDWTAILDPDHPQFTHPQYGLGRLLQRLGVAPAKVRPWTAPGLAATPPGRAEAISRALRPAASMRDSSPPAHAALDGVERIDGSSPQEEASVVALVMREALETPGRTAALVTPDRGLARRVAAELGRWEIEVDDSAGVPLAQTPPGVFLRLVARAVIEGLAPVPLLALLKHPLAALGGPPAGLRRAVAAFEVAALRGPRPPAGIEGLRRVTPDDGRGHRALVDSLELATGPLIEIVARAQVRLGEILRAHVAAAEALAASGDDDGAARLWAGEAGEVAAEFVAEIAQAADALAPMAPASYPPVLDTLMAGRVVRPRFGRHPRLHIWGLLEARLQHADVLVFGGLNEGTWPPEANVSPWMSRPMAARFGLPSPERRIGLTAHDFSQAFSAPRVVMTRSTRVEGTPTVPSRWLRRLETLVKGTALEATLQPRRRWLDWVAALDAAGRPRPATPPAPRPPVAARPRRLSVTRIETWIRDPYAIYARYVLDLEPLPAIDAEPGAAERGDVIHAVLDRFVRDHPGTLPDDALERLVALGRATFAERMAWPGVRAFWWPRFLRIARWFVDFERARRAAGHRPLATEVEGTLELPGPAGTFLLTARADRIDRLGDGLVITDYKTGQIPTWPQVLCGLAPQLPLEAAIARAGGFRPLPKGEVTALVYVRLTGGRESGREVRHENEVADLAERALAGLARRVAAYDDPATPYLSRPRPMFLGRFAEYDHLARVKEWLTAAGDGA